MLNNPFFRSAIDLGFLLLAGLQWFTFFASFDPKTALHDIIKPMAFTFLAFQWKSLFEWLSFF